MTSSRPDAAARKREIYAAAFKVYDTDGSNSIDAAELGSLMKDLRWNVSDEDLREALAALDKDGNGDIDLEEFLNWSEFAWQKFVLQAPSKSSRKKAASAVLNDDHMASFSELGENGELDELGEE